MSSVIFTAAKNLLDQLLSKLDSSEMIVTVGDYVDRGEQSLPTLERLHDLQSTDPNRTICLKGNHEVMLLEFLDEPVKRGRRWLRNGGLQTLASFGVTGVTETMSPDDLRTASDQFRARIPDAIENWLRNLPLTWSSGNLHAVHAGANPAQPLSEQNQQDFLWGHKDFLNQPRSDDIWVAHGHTVTDPPQQTMSRISIDTGAYYSGRLTAARCLPSGKVGFIQTVA